MTSRTAPATRKVRVQMNLPPASMERLDALVTATESSSYAEVMRNALKLYEAAVAEAEEGGNLFVLRDGEYVPVLTLIGK